MLFLPAGFVEYSWSFAESSPRIAFLPTLGIAAVAGGAGAEDSLRSF